MDGGLILPPGFRTAGARLELDPSAPINRGLVGFWPLDQVGGTVARDISPRRLDGTLTNINATATSGWAASARGRVINFDGSDDYVNLGPNAIGQNGNFSASIWFRHTSNNRAIFGRGLDALGDPWSLTAWVTASDTIASYVVTTSAGAAGYGAVGTTPLVVGNWYHLVAVYKEAATYDFYLNGVLEASASLGGTSVLRSTASPFTIGRGENGGGSAFFAGSQSSCRVWRLALSAADVRELNRDRWAGTIDPITRLFFSARSANAVTSVSLTGIALTASAGSVEEGIAVAASGSAATSAAGTPTSSIATTSTGSAATASAGTATSGIGMAVTGEALTTSAGSLAYTIGFILTGVASATAGGTLGTSGGDTSTERSLTGISMTALPGNVRVTGGTRWTPQAPQAVTPPSLAGNTLQPPPRLTGDIAADTRAMNQWLATFYDQFVKAKNVLGRIDDHETRIAALEADDT